MIFKVIFVDGSVETVHAGTLLEKLDFMRSGSFATASPPKWNGPD